MSLPTLVANALSKDAKGGASRMNLKLRGTELQVQPLLAAEVQPTSHIEELKHLYPRVPNQDSVHGIELPLHWKPRVEYRVLPSKSGGRVQIKAPHETFGTARLTLSSDQIGQADTEELSIAVDPYLEISSAWDDVVGTLDETSEDKPLASLSKIQHIRQSAEQQKEKYANRSQELLSLAREALLGWIVIALHGIEEGPEPPREGQDLWLRPSQYPEDFGSNDERQREALCQKFSRYGLFAAEISKLWEMIYSRTTPKDLQLDAIAEGLDVPEAITSTVAHVLELTSSSLEGVDEDMIHSQALICACEAIEGVIVETGVIPSKFENYRSDPTSSQKNDARFLLMAVKGTEPRSFESYKDVADTVENQWGSIGLTSEEQESKSGRSIVKGSKRFAELSPTCDYEQSSNYNHEDLISELREADGRGELPE